MRASENVPGPFSPDKGPFYYYITDRKRLRHGSLVSNIRRVLRRGVDVIQIREKDLSDRELFALARKTVALARERGCKVLVNSRADVALAAGAHGVHLPSEGMRVSDVKPWVPVGFIIGISVHSVKQARAAAGEGADYVLLGPVYRTPSKIRYGPPLGLDYLKRTAAALPIPVFGLGGIRPDRIRRVLDAGAAGVAGITLFQGDGTWQ